MDTGIGFSDFFFVGGSHPGSDIPGGVVPWGRVREETPLLGGYERSIACGVIVGAVCLSVVDVGSDGCDGS